MAFRFSCSTKRSRSDRRCTGWRRTLAGALPVALIGALAIVPPRPAAAQIPGEDEGALFLLLPMGARAVATGGAVAAADGGTESIWWNPAAMARLRRAEIAIHHAQTFAATSDALVLLVPWRTVGVFAIAANLFDLGEQEVVPPEGGPPIGTILPRNVVLSASYATGAGSRLDLGLTYKLVQVRVDCTGQCATVPVEASTSSAVDLGARFDLSGWVPLSLGAAIRNVGPRIQLADRPTADRLPSRWQIGVLYELPEIAPVGDDLVVRLSADVVSAMRDPSPGARVGGEAVWQERVSLRAGYVFRDRGGRNAEAAGPAVGLGVVAGRLGVDIAREFQGLAVDAGQPPTFLTLRYRF